MKKIISLMTLILLSSCLGGPQKSEDLLACPAIFIFPKLELNLNLISPIIKPYTLHINGKKVSEACDSYSSPCVSSEEISGSSIKLDILLLNEPTELDVQFSMGSPEVMVINKENLKPEIEYVRKDCADLNANIFSLDVQEE